MDSTRPHISGLLFSFTITAQISKHHTANVRSPLRDMVMGEKILFQCFCVFSQREILHSLANISILRAKARFLRETQIIWEHMQHFFCECKRISCFFHQCVPLRTRMFANIHLFRGYLDISASLLFSRLSVK